jgi:hypothetical protein
VVLPGGQMPEHVVLDSMDRAVPYDVPSGWRRGVMSGIALVAALAAAWLVAWPWLDRRFGYFVDDGLYHALRLYVFDHLVRQGELFPRWWPDLHLGYGYPLFNYYSPGLYWAGEIVHLAGASIYRSLQWVGALAALTGALGGCVLGWVIFRHPLAGAVVAIAYVLSPYPFLTNLYNRSALPEAMGQALLPWVLAACWLAVRSTGILWLLLPALALAALVLAHSLTALIGAAASLVWIGAAAWGLGARQRWAMARGLAGVGLGLALSAFFWLPALFEQGAVHTELGRLGNLSYERWLFDPIHPTPNPVDMAVPQPYELTLGAPIDLHWFYPHAPLGLSGPAKPSLAQAVLLCGAALALVFELAGTQRQGQSARSQEPAGEACSTGLPLPVDQASAPHPFPWAVVGACTALLLVLWFLNVTWSAPVWRTVPLLATLQFPWRLWGLFSLALACAAAGMFTWLARQGRPQWLLAAVLVAFVAVNALGRRPGEGRLSQGEPPVVNASLLRATEGDTIAAGTLSGGEFLPVSVALEQPFNERLGGRASYESVFPEAGWIAGRVWPYSGSLQVLRVSGDISWTEADVAVEGMQPAELAFHTTVFPGWRAYVDGRPAAMRPAPFDPDAHVGYGFAIVPVPPGRHRVQLAFGSTFWRTLGFCVSLAGVAALALLALWRLRRPSPRAWRACSLATVIVAAAIGGGRLWSDVWAVLRAPPRPLHARDLVVLDLAQALQQGDSIRLGTPDGNRVGQFIDLRTLALSGDRRPWLFMHPPSRLEVELTVPPHAVFQAGLALDPQAWDAPGADGVRFVVEVIDRLGTLHTLLSEPLQPQVRAADRGWRFVTLDLGAFSTQRVRLVLRTEGLQTPDYDWAGWGAPLVYVDSSARYPPPPTVSPVPRARAP